MIFLIHAMRASMAPIEEAFARLWPEAELAHLLDDSLPRDLARAGTIEPEMTERFLALARYAASRKPEAILFTCSAFGPCIEACARDLAPLPILKPNEAMIEEARALPGPIGLLASFAPTLASMPPEFAAQAPSIELRPCLVEGALAALERGEPKEHDRLAAGTAAGMTDCAAFAVAQFSLARAASAIAAATGRPVVTTPDSAVRKLKRLLSKEEWEKPEIRKKLTEQPDPSSSSPGLTR